MRIDDRITSARIRDALKEKKHIFWGLGICCVALLLFFALKNLNTRSVTVWETGSLKDCYMTRETESRLQEFCKGQGLEFGLLIRSPEDTYYDAAFTTSGVYTSDIFILSSEEMQRYREDGVFLDLSGTALSAYGKDGFYAGQQLLGIPVAEDKYLALNTKSDIETEVLTEAVYRIFGKEPRQ